jgi:hypothetical protein
MLVGDPVPNNWLIHFLALFAISDFGMAQGCHKFGQRVCLQLDFMDGPEKA